MNKETIYRVAMMAVAGMIWAMMFLTPAVYQQISPYLVAFFMSPISIEHIQKRFFNKR